MIIKFMGDLVTLSLNGIFYIFTISEWTQQSN